MQSLLLGLLSLAAVVSAIQAAPRVPTDSEKAATFHNPRARTAGEALRPRFKKGLAVAQTAVKRDAGCDGATWLQRVNNWPVKEDGFEAKENVYLDSGTCAWKDEPIMPEALTGIWASRWTYGPINDWFLKRFENSKCPAEVAPAVGTPAREEFDAAVKKRINDFSTSYEINQLQVTECLDDYANAALDTPEKKKAACVARFPTWNKFFQRSLWSEYDYRVTTAEADFLTMARQRILPYCNSLPGPAPGPDKHPKITANTFEAGITADWSKLNIVASACEANTVAFENAQDATELWIKGKKFTVHGMLGLSNPLAGSHFIVIWRLTPRQYHQIHMPLTSTVLSVRAMGNRHLTVHNTAINDRGMNVFTENVRAVVKLRNTVFGEYYMVIVGATCVYGIEFPGYDTIAASYQASLANANTDTGNGAEITIPAPVDIPQGTLWSRFRFGGSTVVLVLPQAVGTVAVPAVNEYHLLPFLKQASDNQEETQLRVGMPVIFNDPVAARIC
jgi:phosphatidylserine decarboxylase precursor